MATASQHPTRTQPEKLTYYVAYGQEGHEDRVKVLIETFSAGNTIQWLTWLKSFEKLINLKGWAKRKEGDILFQNARILLRDEALDAFNAAAPKEETVDTFKEVMREVAMEFLVRDPREYLLDKLKNSRKARTVSVHQHLAEMRNIASLVGVLPVDDEPVPEKTLRYYFRKSMTMKWQDKYDDSGKELTTLSELARYFTRLEQNQERREKSGNERRQDQQPGRSNKNKGENKSGPASTKPKPSGGSDSGKWCDHHHTSSHTNEECHFQQKKKAQEELNYCDLPDGPSDELHAITDVDEHVDVKCETIVRLKGTGCSRFFTALVDSGASRTLVIDSLLDKTLLAKMTPVTKSFDLPKGTLAAKGQLELELQLTEFGEQRTVH